MLADGCVAYLPRTQPGKSARERDRVLDRDVIACHDDAFEQQPDEPLAALKVQLIQPCSEYRGKGGEIVSEPVEPSASHLLCLKLLPPCVRGFLLCFQPLAPCMEFFDLDGAGLVRIDDSIHLGLELACGLLESDEVACPLRCAVPARSPRLDLLLEHLWTPDPGHDCIPDDPVKLISTDTGRSALSWISLVNHVVVGLAFVEEVLDNWKPKVDRLVRGAISDAVIDSDDFVVLLEEDVVRLDGRVIDADVTLGRGAQKIQSRMVGIHTPKGYCFFVTNVPRATHGPNQIGDLYRIRWEIEIR